MAPSPAEWLSQVLQKRGPDELPYSDSEKHRIKQHVVDLITDFTNLVVKLQKYTHIDGNTVTLLAVEGTIPMYYMGVKYNIPVSIWLPEQYPRAAPIVYVVPTPDMIIKPRHSFVNASGVVNSPYIRNWSYPRSDLVGMSQDTSIQFGQDPPLFSKPPGYVEPVASPVRPSSQDTFQAHNPIHGNSASPYGQTPPVQQTSYTSPSAWGGPVAAAQGARPQTPPHRSPKDAFRAAALAALTRRIQGSLGAANEAASAEMDRLLEQQAHLTQSQQRVADGVSRMQEERHKLEACVLEMSTKATALQQWLAQNEDKSARGEVDADTAIVAADALSAQALEGQAEDMALEDALYALDKALQAGALPPDAYIKQVRTLCGRQFMVRALSHKVAARQHELQRTAGTAGRGPGGQPHGRTPSHVQMPQGDSWSHAGVLANPLVLGR